MQRISQHKAINNMGHYKETSCHFVCPHPPHLSHKHKSPSRLRFENIYSGDSRDKDRCKIFSFDSHIKQLSTAYCPAVLQNNYAYIMQRKEDLSVLVVVTMILL